MFRVAVGRCALLLLALACGACGDDAAPALSMRIVTPAGLDPRAAGGLERIVVRVREAPPGVGPREVVVLEGDANTDFALDYALYSTASRIDVGVELTGPGARLLGAAAPFVPNETDGVVDVLVAPPSSCALRAGVALSTARGAAQATRLGSYALIVGGAPAGSAAAAQVELVDLLGARASVADALIVGGAPFEVAAAAVVALSTRSALLLLRDRDAVLRYDLDATTAARSTAILVHAGAHGGTLAARLTSGAAIVGGVDAAGAPLADITWIATDGSTTRGTLSVARRQPAVLALADGTLLVAGGAETPSAPLFERIAEAAASVPHAATDDDQIRHGGTLVSVAATGGALLLGGLDGAGEIRTDVRIFDDCPAACTLVETAALTNTLRVDTTIAVLPTEGALLLGGRDGSGAPIDAAWHVTLAPTAPRLQRVVHSPLPAPRAAPAALVLPSGLVWLAAGVNASGPTSDLQVCFPAALALP